MNSFFFPVELQLGRKKKVTHCERGKLVEKRIARWPCFFVIFRFSLSNNECTSKIDSFHMVVVREPCQNRTPDDNVHKCVTWQGFQLQDFVTLTIYCGSWFFWSVLIISLYNIYSPSEVLLFRALWLIWTTKQAIPVPGIWHCSGPHIHSALAVVEGQPPCFLVKLSLHRSTQNSHWRQSAEEAEALWAA